MRRNVGIDGGTRGTHILRNFIGEFSHIFDVIEASNLWRFGIVGTELRPGPFFLRQIAWRQKKNFGVRARLC